MAEIQFNVNMDLVDKYVPAEDITIPQEDNLSVKFTYSIFNKEIAEDLTGATDIVVSFVKPDGHIVLQSNGTLELPNKVNIVANAQAFTYVGKVYMQVQYKKGTQTFNTRQAFFWVEKSGTSCTTVASSDYAPYLDNIKETWTLLSAVDLQALIDSKQTAENAQADVDELTPRVTTLETDVSSLKARVTAVETKNTQQDTRLSSLENQQGTFATSISNLQASDTTHGTRLTNLETGQTTQDNRLIAVEIKNSTQDTRLTALETTAGDIPTMKTDIEAIKGVNTTQDSRIGALETAKTANDSKNATQDTNIGNNATAISALQTSQTTQDTKIANLEAYETSSDSRINAVETKNTQQDTRIANLESANSTQDTRLIAVENKNTTQDTRLADLETFQAATTTKDTQQDNRLTAIETKNASQDASITALNTSEADHEERLTNLESSQPDLTPINNRLTAVETKNTAQDTRLTDLETAKAANDTKNTQQDSRLTSLENGASLLATTVANNKTAQDTINTSTSNSLTALTTRVTDTETKNTQQDTRLDTVEAKNATQDTRIAALEGADSVIIADINALEILTGEHEGRLDMNDTKNDSQDSLIASNTSAISSLTTTVNNNQTGMNTRVTALETAKAANDTKNTAQDNRLMALENYDVTQDNRMTTIETKNSTQDTRMTTIEGVNTTQNTRLTAVENKNTEQDELIHANEYSIYEPVKKVKRFIGDTNGWQFRTSQQASITHDDKYSQVPLTVDMLVSIDQSKLDFTGDEQNQKRLVFKPNQWYFGIKNDLKISLDVRNATGDWWIGEMLSKTNLNFGLIKETPLESYGSSQGITTDGVYIYTTNNRLDKNSYNVHKRKKDGTLLKGVVLPVGFGHPCGICIVGRYLFVLANDFPNNVVNHKIFVFDTNDMTIHREIPVTLNSGGGLSGIAHRKGLFYCTDWLTAGGITNIYVYDSEFRLLNTSTIDAMSVQGLDIAGDRLYVASNSEHKIIEYDLDSKVRLDAYDFYATVEGEDLCVTPEGTILHGDVSIFREYKIYKPRAGEPSKEHLERLTLTIEDNGGGTKLVSFYRQGVLQGTKTFTGNIQNLNTYGVLINGSFNLATFKQSCDFKLKGLGIANKKLVPTSDMSEITNRSLYDIAYVDCSIAAPTLKNTVNNTNLTAHSSIYNESNIIVIGGDY
ncbi:hypothetical protein [Bacillus cereus]